MDFYFIVFFLLLISLIIFIKYISGKMHHKKLKWILGGYIAILLISFIVVHVLPKGDFLNEKAVEQNGEREIDREYQDFYSAAEEGRLDQIESAHKNKEWNFEYIEEQLEIVIVDRENFNIRVIVKNKDIYDNMIEVASYTGRSIMNGIEYTDKVKPPEVTLEGNRLKIANPESLKIELARFDRDLTAKQFFPEGDNNNYMGSVNIFHVGPPVLYIQVPKNVQVEGYY